MRKILRLGCMTCGYKWIAPNKGNCPKCHGGKTKIEGQHIETAPLQ